MPVFSDENIAKLFGSEAAEDEPEDRFLQYFFYNKTYENLISSLPLRILVGHKGVGKSALLKRAVLHDRQQNIMSVFVTPGDISGVTVRKNVEDFNELVEYWKRGILGIIAQHLIGESSADIFNTEKMAGFAKRVSSFVPSLVSALSKKVGDIAPELHKATVDQFIQNGIITVYIDDIDRGWSASPFDIKNISALLNAMRDISGSDGRIRFRIGLRSDVYFLVRTSDESTDKIESNVIWLTWTNHEVLAIMAKKIETFFGGAARPE